MQIYKNLANLNQKKSLELKFVLAIFTLNTMCYPQWK